MSRRIERVNELLRQEISRLLTLQIKDPRLDGVITITQVTTSSDLRNARVHLSAMGDEETRQNALAGIQSAATFIRRELRSRVNLRYIPFLSFELDIAQQEANYILDIMDGIRNSVPSHVSSTTSGESGESGSLPDSRQTGNPGSDYTGPLSSPNRSV
ncbi:MAG: ribosome-binding factor A [SAR202 cluster bacterium Io17-Chloro-G4]|nr:MAG: ribosome-binding factor A [SAR202 cluster bacterium Io17-Chloro-G4]